MERSDQEDDYAAVAAPSTDARPVADAESAEPEARIWRRAAVSTRPFGGALRGVPGTIIVMSPTDLAPLVGPRRRRSARPPSMRAFRTSQERIQLTTGGGSGAEGHEAPDADQKPADEAKDEEIEHKPADGGASPEAELMGKNRRRKSVYLKEDVLEKAGSVVEPYKIEIPLRKKVNRSTKKKLWREIERRKPFITENVREHIRVYAKPPFITWGCRNCVFPYESEA